jgi:uncharacterized protein (TIGR03435 family)
MKSVVLLSLAAALAARAQAPVFEVASVKPNRSMSPGSSIHLSRGLVQMENVSLKKVMLNAWGIPDDREYMIDGPAWLTTEHFNVEARFPADTPVAQVRQMVQSLLAERFQLALHRETRQLPIFTLTVARNGPKLHAVESGQGRTSGDAGRLEAKAISIQKLADLLARMAGTPVVDATGLKGVYDFVLEWSPDERLRMPGAPAEGAGAASGAPSLSTALEEQLGLKLASGKGPVEVLVVDRVERIPTAN